MISVKVIVHIKEMRLGELRRTRIGEKTIVAKPMASTASVCS